MSRLDAETKRKLREMGVTSLVDAIDIQDDALTLGMVFEERIKLAVDDAHAAFTHSKVESTDPGTPAKTESKPKIMGASK